LRPAHRRLAYICSDPGIPADGSKGASVHFREMARALRGHGVRVDPFVARGGPSPESALPNVRVFPPAKGPDKAQLLLDNAEAMAAAIDDAGPYDAVYERLSLFGTAGRDVARLASIPFVVEVNAPLWEEAARFRGLDNPNQALAVCRDVLLSADIVLSVSTELARVLAGIGVPASRIRVMTNGVHLGAFDRATPIAPPHVLQDAPMLLFSGSLKEWHGLEFLFDALEAYRERRTVTLRVVGDGPLGERVRSEARRRPDLVFADGAVPHEQIPGLLLGADILVAPYTGSSPAYFSPLKLVEAIAARRPILASRVPPVLEAVAGVPNVALFQPDDIEDFGTALDSLLDRATTSWSLADERLREGCCWTAKAREVLSLLDGLEPANAKEAACG
jgi:starch synthase